MRQPKGLHRVKVTVVEVNGCCRAAHQPSDEVIFGENEVRGKLCFDAMCGLMSKVRARRDGPRPPWLEDKNEPVFHVCPGAGSPVIFEVSRSSGNLLEE